MDQTEHVLELARDDIDRRLIKFGYNPWQVDAFGHSHRKNEPGKFRGASHGSEVCVG